MATLHPRRRRLSYGIASPRRGGALLVPRPRSAATAAPGVNPATWGAGTASVLGRPDAWAEGNLEEESMKFARVGAALAAVTIFAAACSSTPSSSGGGGGGGTAIKIGIEL